MNMMLIGVIIIFILQPGYLNSEDINKGSSDSGSVVIGQSCKRDHQCIRNAYCRSQKTCWCDETYTQDPNMQLCHATAGTNCDNHDDCKTMSNAECVQGSCVCMNNYFLDINNSSNCIILPEKPGDRCQRHDECFEKLIKAHCVNEKCRCNGDYKFANETGSCIEARGIYQPCKQHYQCYDEARPNGLYCLDGECAYKHQVASGSGVGFSIHLMVLGLGWAIFP